MNPYDALRKHAAVIDLSGRARLRLTGEDRKRLLHAMTTNHIQDMQPGQTLYAFFLNAQGRILADAHVFCAEEYLLLDLEPENREKICQHLDKYIIADDVTIEDCTETTSELAVEGPHSAEFAGFQRGDVLQASVTGQPGFRMVIPAQEKPGLMSEVLSAGCVEAAPDAVRTVRIENGVPRYGEDFSESSLAQETRLLHALHFNKGCYLGQEIVERVRSRALLNRFLTAIRIEGSTPPDPGTEVRSGDKPAGKITSAVFSPDQNCVRGFAVLRAEFANPGTPLSVGGADAQVIQNT
jgi:tRNA-modifying protein YgfZ